MTDHTQSLFETAQYLSEHARSGFANMPEKSIAKVMNNAPPSVREAIAVQYKGLELLAESGGRLEPFQPRKEYADITAHHPKELTATINKMRTEELSTALMDRMGTNTPDEPVSRRDYLEAAFDQNGGGEA